MSKFNVNHITNKIGDQGPTIAGVTTVSSTGAMRIPSGNTGMRVEYNTVKDNDIIRDGLILHLDFANPDCLVSGTKVRDLSGAGIVDSGTISGATYSPDGGGSLYFDNRGGIDFGAVDPNGPFLLSGTTSTGDKLSVCSWVGNVDMTKSSNVIAAAWNSTGTSGGGWLIATNENDNTGNRPQPSVIVSDGADGSGAWARPGWTGPNIPAYDPRSLNYWQTVKSVNSGIGNTTVAVGKDKFNHLGQTLARWRTETNTVSDGWGTRTWINGLKNGMATPIGENSGYGYTGETGDWGLGRNLRIGRTDNSSGSYMKGNIAVVMLYNRELTHAEMQQNYNAQRYRFGR